MIQATKFNVDRRWKQILDSFGINVHEVLKQAGLPGDIFARKDAQLSVEEYFSLWNALDVIVDDASFPIKLGQMTSPESFHPVFFAAMCSPNLNVAMDRVSKYKRLIGPVTLQLQQRKDSTTITLDCLFRSGPMPASLVGSELVFFVHLARTALRDKIKPLKVISSVQLSPIPEYGDYFDTLPVKGENNQIIFSSEDASRPFFTENHNMWTFFEPEMRRRLADLKEGDNFSKRVISTLYELLPGGQGAVEEVAKTLGISKRTLQRNLSNENTNFQELLNQTREKLARHYLENSDLTSEEISFLLGYDDPSSFTRAFKAWTGETPGRVRSDLSH